MKKGFLKTVSLVMALAIIFTSAFALAASAEDVAENDFPCGGVIEEVDVEILYAPLTSRIVIGGFGPVITGTVFKVTYLDGESEILTVKKNGNEYYAGDFQVYTYYFGFEPIISDYGIESRTIRISNEGEQQFGGYSGEVDLKYLNLPSFADIAYLISAYFRIWF